MKWMIADIYKLRKFDPSVMSLFDLYHVLSVPAKVQFTFEGLPHEVESVPEDGNLSIRFDDKWYRTVDDFFKKAEIGGELVTTLYEELYDFKMIGCSATDFKENRINERRCCHGTGQKHTHEL